MGNKKDIGKLFEAKLSAGNKIPKESIWEKINTSLDEENRKRKRILFYWWLGGGIIALLGLTLLFGTGNFLNSKNQISGEYESFDKNNLSNPETGNIEKSINISKEDSLQFENNGEEKLLKIKHTNESRTLNDSENPSKTTSEKRIQKGSSKGNSIDETYTVSKKYYYYNSKDGKNMVTSNKAEIDSLVSQQYKLLDSTATDKIENPED